MARRYRLVRVGHEGLARALEIPAGHAYGHAPGVYVHAGELAAVLRELELAVKGYGRIPAALVHNLAAELERLELEEEAP